MRDVSEIYFKHFHRELTFIEVPSDVGAETSEERVSKNRTRNYPQIEIHPHVIPQRSGVNPAAGGGLTSPPWFSRLGIGSSNSPGKEKETPPSSPIAKLNDSIHDLEGQYGELRDSGFNRVNTTVVNTRRRGKGGDILSGLKNSGLEGGGGRGGGRRSIDDPIDIVPFQRVSTTGRVIRGTLSSP